MFKPALALLLLIFLSYSIGWERILLNMLNANVDLLFLSLVCAFVGNLFCVLRWNVISNSMGLSVSYPRMASIYFQGIYASSIILGGNISGDVWRSIGLSQASVNNGHPKSLSLPIASVILDRIAGYWGLVLISFLALILLAIQLMTDINFTYVDDVSYDTYFGAIIYTLILLVI